MTEKTIEQQIDEKTEELRFLMAAKQKQDSGVAKKLKGGYFKSNGKNIYIKSIKPTSSGVHLCEGVCFSDFNDKRFTVSMGFTIDSNDVEKLEKISRTEFRQLLNDCFIKYSEKTDRELA